MTNTNDIRWSIRPTGQVPKNMILADVDNAALIQVLMENRNEIRTEEAVITASAEGRVVEIKFANKFK
jgi:hypothetical protein